MVNEQKQFLSIRNKFMYANEQMKMQKIIQNQLANGA